MDGRPAMQKYCTKCVYRDRNNDTIVCLLPHCAVKLKNGTLTDKLTGKPVRSKKNDV